MDTETKPCLYVHTYHTFIPLDTIQLLSSLMPKKSKIDSSQMILRGGNMKDETEEERKE